MWREGGGSIWKKSIDRSKRMRGELGSDDNQGRSLVGQVEDTGDKEIQRPKIMKEHD